MFCSGVNRLIFGFEEFIGTNQIFELRICPLRFESFIHVIERAGFRHRRGQVRTGSDPIRFGEIRIESKALMASTLVSNAAANTDRARVSAKKKKRRGQAGRDQARSTNNNQNSVEWKSEAQEQVYSSKLLQALRQVRLSSSPPAPRRGRAVREAADRVLAVTAKGRTRWSRAILTSRLKIKFMKNKRQRVTASGKTRSKKPKVSILRFKSKNLPAVRRKTRVLGRIVPGCRQQPLPVILEEATDYIAALQMQVRAMSALAELLSGSSSDAGSSSGTVSRLTLSRPPTS